MVGGGPELAVEIASSAVHVCRLNKSQGTSRLQGILGAEFHILPPTMPHLDNTMVHKIINVNNSHGSNSCNSLKTVTSLNKEARLLKFHFS